MTHAIILTDGAGVDIRVDAWRVNIVEEAPTLMQRFARSSRLYDPGDKGKRHLTTGSGRGSIDKDRTKSYPKSLKLSE